MRTDKHTKGPWHFAYDGPSLPIVCNENTIVALVRTGTSNEHDEIEANARLIAAAPDLYEACQAAFVLLSEYAPIWAVKVEDQLREALARARG